MNKHYCNSTSNRYNERQTLASLAIIVPVFNLVKHQENLLSWISDPRLAKYEKIIVHDSSDQQNSRNFQELISQYQRIKFYSQNFHSPGLARNFGIERTSCEWITFWDADDLPQIGAFQDFFMKAQRHNVNVAVASYEIRDLEHELVSTRILCNQTESRINSELMINPGIWTWIFRRGFIGNNRFSNLKRGEDQLFLAQLNVFDQKLFKDHKVTYIHKVGHSGQISRNTTFSFDLLNSAREMLELYKISGPYSRKYCLIASSLAFLVFVREIGIKQIRDYIYHLHDIVFSNNLAMIRNMVFLLVTFLKSKRMQNHHSRSSLTVYLAGGLGNQLFQLAFTLSNPRVMNVNFLNMNLELKEAMNANLLVDYEESRNSRIAWKLRDTGRFESKLFNFFLRPLSESHDIYHKAQRFFFTRILKLYFAVRTLSRHELILPEGIGYDNKLDDVCPYGNKIVIGYFQSEIWAKQLRQTLQRFLDENFADCLELLRDQGVKVEKDVTIGIQVRLGDYLLKSNSSMGHITKGYVDAAISQLTMQPKATVILFSDSMSKARELIPMEKVAKLVEVPESWTLFENLFLMSKIGNLVISNSTFGWWGAFLSDVESKAVVCPRPWFKALKTPKGLVPERWIEVDITD